VLRVEAVWLAVEPLDLRIGMESALARVVAVFGAAHPHHAYLFVAADLKPSHRADVAVSHLQNPNRQERREISGGFAGSPESRRTPLKWLSSGSATTGGPPKVVRLYFKVSGADVGKRSDAGPLFCCRPDARAGARH